MSVILVDWLGRGGIAHCSEAWRIELSALGRRTTLVTRPGRELEGDIEVRTRQNQVFAHRAVVAAAVQAIREVRPSTVIVQNYVVPWAERPVYRAARRCGARLVAVVHDHELHSALAGARTGLRQLLRQADSVVAHTPYVARQLARYSRRRDVIVVPHPVQVGLLRHSAREAPPAPQAKLPSGKLAVHFGVLRRGYKGTSTVLRLASQGVAGWDFALAGAGAPKSAVGAVSRPGFMEPSALVDLVQASEATLLPYTRASQSGAVRLAQVLGSVPVATAVGGIPDQIEHGVSGILVPARAPLGAWYDALAQLDDDVHRHTLIERARERAWREHASFVTAIGGLVA